LGSSLFIGFITQNPKWIKDSRESTNQHLTQTKNGEVQQPRSPRINAIRKMPLENSDGLKDAALNLDATGSLGKVNSLNRAIPTLD
jgi:hypothetical protein